jgi:hypothetical protein
MITILGAGGAIGGELAKLLVSSNFDSGKFSRELGFVGTPYADGVRATAAAFQHVAAANA